jgi:hypothetical protein
MHALDRLPVLLPCREPVCDMDPTDHQNTVFLPDLATNVSAEQTLSRTDPARLQRASEGPGQSAAG